MTTTYTTPAQAAAEIRATLRKRGITQRQVSIRARSFSMGSAIDIDIHDYKVDIREVKNVAAPAEKVAIDRSTGEVLSGGNRFLHVGYSDKAKDAFRFDHFAELAALSATSSSDLELGRVVPVAGVSYYISVNERKQHTLNKLGLGKPAWLYRCDPQSIANAILCMKGE